MTLTPSRLHLLEWMCEHDMHELREEVMHCKVFPPLCCPSMENYCNGAILSQETRIHPLLFFFLDWNVFWNVQFRSASRVVTHHSTCGWTSSSRNQPLLPHHLLEAALGSLSVLRKCSHNLTVSRSCYLPIARKSMWTVKGGRAVRCGSVLRMQPRYPLDKLVSSAVLWPHGSPLM